MSYIVMDNGSSTGNQLQAGNTLSYRLSCNNVQGEGVKPRPDLAYRLFCYALLHNKAFCLGSSSFAEIDFAER